MRRRIRGLAAALLCVELTALNGCGKETPLYTAGVEQQTESISSEAVNNASDEDLLNDASEDSAEATSDTAVIAADTLAGLDSSVLPAETETVAGYVYVCGAVNVPGVYPISEDMRVCDAIALAGGFSAEADDEWLNQAAAVSDGTKLYVYTTEETDLMKASGMSAEGLDSGSALNEGITGMDSSASAAGAGENSTDKVNLNTATREELMTLPGIGESKADA
ncbi:MAG: SLBB domain-containing protein, partial [Lachnospiraceae bacterium]|nr:SLBB domain-containing protein [Lachnospiraceae bacterium]